MKREDNKATHRGVHYLVYGDRNDYSVSISNDEPQGELRKVLKSCPFCRGKSGLSMSNTHTPHPWIGCVCGLELQLVGIIAPRLRGIARAKLVMNAQIDRLIDHWNRRFKYRV